MDLDVNVSYIKILVKISEFGLGRIVVEHNAKPDLPLKVVATGEVETKGTLFAICKNPRFTISSTWNSREVDLVVSLSMKTDKNVWISSTSRYKFRAKSGRWTVVENRAVF